MAIKVTKTYYIDKYKKKFGDKFDYSKFEYSSAKSSTLIICPEHGPFYMEPHKHLISLYGCRKCGAKNRWKRDKITTEEFINRATKIHENVFDYSKTCLSGMENKVIIICKKHGEFSQKAANHLTGNGCPQCRNLKTTEEFIFDCKRIHGEKYKYDKVEYTHGKSEVLITCRNHGDFLQKANNHLDGKGCPKCRYSKEEREIERTLIKNNIQFEKNKTFIDCINPKTNHKLEFDFYILNKNLLIEYDGKQHYEFVENWQQNRQKFEDGLFKDEIKNEYCKHKGIKLVRIPYTKYKNIEKIISLL